MAGALAIVAVASALGLEIHARTPGLDRYCRDQLLRARGPLPAPDDIAIVAIDERSIARFGRFPWPRSVLASVIDAIAAAGPKAIALDILLTDPTREREDTALAEAVKRAGNVVAAAQLVHASPSGGPAAWLLPISPIARSAAAVGHVNVLAQSDGVARQLLIRAADDEGLWLRAMALETIRVADGVPAQSVTDTGTATVAGTRVIPAEVSSPPLILGHTHAAPETLRAARMAIDYIGPTGAFAAATYSISDIIDGKAAAARLADKYVLIGATAVSLGDRFSSPFLHDGNRQNNPDGTFMPGVEVLANALNSVLRSRFYSQAPVPVAIA